MDVSGSHPISSELCVRELRKTLQKWQAVRARVKGRVIRYEVDRCDGDRVSLNDLVEEAAPCINRLAGVSLRNVSQATERQRHALLRLWDIFRSLPTHGNA